MQLKSIDSQKSCCRLYCTILHRLTSTSPTLILQHTYETLCWTVCVGLRHTNCLDKLGVGGGPLQAAARPERPTDCGQLPLLESVAAAWLCRRLLCRPLSAPLLPVTGQRHRGTALRAAQRCAALQRRRQLQGSEQRCRHRRTDGAHYSVTGGTPYICRA